MGSDDMRCILQHAFTSDELDAAAALHSKLAGLKNGKYIPIDTSRENYKAKMTKYGIRHFVAYDIEIDGKKYVLKCRAVRKHNLMEEHPYSLKEKNS